VHDNLDIVRMAGGKNLLFVTSNDVTVIDGFVTIEFVAGADNPTIHAIEIIAFITPPAPISPPIAAPTPNIEVPTAVVPAATAPVNAPNPTVTTPVTVPVLAPITIPTTSDVNAPGTRINVGGGQYIDVAGNVWIADAYFNKKGKVFNSCANGVIIDIANTIEDAFYCLSRYFPQSTTTPPFLYEIPIPTTPVPTSQYEVRLHFVESVRPYLSKWNNFCV
jgi:hypothetical protein